MENEMKDKKETLRNLGLEKLFDELEEQGWHPMLCDTPVPVYDNAVPCGKHAQSVDMVEMLVGDKNGAEVTGAFSDGVKPLLKALGGHARVNEYFCISARDKNRIAAAP